MKKMKKTISLAAVLAFAAQSICLPALSAAEETNAEETNYAAKFGLIKAADNLSDWEIPAESASAVSATVGADGTARTRVRTDELDEDAAAEIKLNLGEEKIKFAEDQCIWIKVRFKSMASEDDTFISMHANLPAQTVHTSTGKSTAFDFEKNHSLLWQTAYVDEEDGQFAYPYSFKQSQGENKLEWNDDGGFSSDGEDIITVTTRLDKCGNSAKYSCEHTQEAYGSSSYETSELGYTSMGDYLENIVIDDTEKSGQYFEVEYARVYNFKKSDLVGEAAILGCDNGVLRLIYATEQKTVPTVTITGADGTIYQSSASVSNDELAVSFSAPVGRYTACISGTGSFEFINNTDTSYHAPYTLTPADGAYDVEVVDDYTVNYPNAEGAENAVISVDGMTENEDYTIEKSGTCVTVKFASALAHQTVYTVTVDGSLHSFKTACDGKTLFHEDFSMPNALTRFEAEALETDGTESFAAVLSDESLELCGITQNGRGHRLAVRNSSAWSNYEVSLKSIASEDRVIEQLWLRNDYALKRWVNYPECGAELSAIYQNKDENGAILNWLGEPIVGSWEDAGGAESRPYSSSEAKGGKYTLRAKIENDTIEFGVYDADGNFINHYRAAADGTQEAVAANSHGKYEAKIAPESAAQSGTVAIGAYSVAGRAHFDELCVSDLNQAFTTGNTKNTDGKLSITFTKEVDSSTLGEISVSGADCYKFLSADKKTVTVVLKNPQIGRYTVTVGNVKAVDGTGVTCSKHFDITVSQPTAHYIRVANGTLLTNLSSELCSVGARLYAARFDSNGALSEVKSSAAENGAQIPLSGTDVRIFLWDAKMSPIEYVNN